MSPQDEHAKKIEHLPMVAASVFKGLAFLSTSGLSVFVMLVLAAAAGDIAVVSPPDRAGCRALGV